ncbi:unnamed protein product [Cyclocybe aegerita]|uniref:RlpA-like protein double-psi beta-barrel domain-containing protein n=1 Tax=Cyclocybe aegerita TaxID=1973307 RepID=A0A8S0VY82_CYCAE|nr:unnamed protein product [Cyclocybe aegerita]
MRFTKTFIAILAAIGSANAFTGFATFYNPRLAGSSVAGTTLPSLYLLAGTPADRNVAAGGKSVTVRVTDECPGCRGDDIDLSTAVFTLLADWHEGRIAVEWDFV